MDDLLDRIVEAILTKQRLEGTMKILRPENGKLKRNKQDSAFLRCRQKILESVENRFPEFQDPSRSDHAARKAGDISSKPSRGERSRSNYKSTYFERRNQHHQTLIRSKSETREITKEDDASPTDSPRTRFSSKHEWITTLKEMADPNDELSSSSGVFDLSRLDVETKAIQDDDPVPTSSRGVDRNKQQARKKTHISVDKRRRSQSISLSETDDGDVDNDFTTQETDASSRSRRRSRRRKNRSRNQVMYHCPKCESSFLVKLECSGDNLKCLFCDYWSSVEPEYMKDEKLEQNFCKIS